MAISKESLMTIAVLMKRTQLKGDEVPAFTKAMNELDAEFKALVKKEAGKGGKKGNGKRGGKDKT